VTGTILRRDCGDGRIAVVLDNPPVNALTADLLHEFAETIHDLQRDGQCRAIVLQSSSEIFSAGLDLKQARDFDVDSQRKIVEGLNLAFHALFGCPKPTVAAVKGPAIAGGCFFVLASDYRVGSTKTKLGLAEVRVGAVFPVGPLEVARAMLGPNDLRRLMLTGQPMTSQVAKTSGILDEVVKVEEVQEVALKAASGLAANPPRTYAEIKHQMRGAVLDRIQRAMWHGANAPNRGWFNDETRAAMDKMIG